MIYLLRHGLDDENYIGGWSDGDLIDEGIVSSHKIAKYIISQNYRIDEIYSSDVKRAITTANIVNEYLNKSVNLLSELRELNKGDITGLRKEVVSELYPNFIDVRSIDIKYPNGESMLDLYRRVKILLNDFILKQDNILIVTHRGVINMLYFILNDIEVSMDKKRFGVEHSSLHMLNPKVKKIERLR